MGRKKGGIPGVSFSWKRALGISNAKSKVSRASGIPLTRGARQRKMGKAMGCCVPFIVLTTGGFAAIAGVVYGVSRLIA